MSPAMIDHVLQANLNQQFLMLLGDHRHHPSCGSLWAWVATTQVDMRKSFDARVELVRGILAPASAGERFSRHRYSSATR
jgi:hypothetical protein